MIIYPAIDLRNGRCVRLLRGDFQQQTCYSENPLELALSYQQQGAQWLHLVDLDAAKDPHQRQSAILQQLAAGCALRLQVGGGIRSLAQAEQLLQLGVARVVIGSICVKQAQLAQHMLAQLGAEQVVFAFDVRKQGSHYTLCSAGWQEDSQLELFDTVARWSDAGLRHLLCTDISRDGTLEGPNLHLYQQLKHDFPGLEIQASGGVASLADLTQLRQAGLAGAITGKALLEGRFSLSEALGSGPC